MGLYNEREYDLVGLFYSFGRYLLLIEQVSFTHFAGLFYSFRRSLLLISQVSFTHFAGLFHSFRRSLLLILQVSFTHFAGLFYSFIRSLLLYIGTQTPDIPGAMGPYKEREFDLPADKPGTGTSTTSGSKY